MTVARKIGVSFLNKNQAIAKGAHLLTLTLLFLLCGASSLLAADSRVQNIDRTSIFEKPVPQMRFSNLPAGQCLKKEFDKNLPSLFQLAREVVGRIDMTSVIGSTLEQTHDQKDSKGSLKVVDDCYLLLGQNTKHVDSQNEIYEKMHDASEVRCDKSITKDSPTANPLSFAWEYILTKK